MRAVVLEPLAAEHRPHDVDVLARLAERLPPLLPVPALDDLRPRRAEPHQEPAAREHVQRRGGHRRVRRRPSGQLHDRRAEPDRRRQRAEPGERRDRVDAPRLGRPRGRVPEPLRLARKLDQLERARARLRVAHVEAELHRVRCYGNDRDRMVAADGAARAGARDHARPRAAERAGARSRGRRRRRACRELQAEVKAAGLWAPHVPPEAGGTGTGFLDYAYLNEQIGRTVWGQLVFGCQAPDAGNAEILHLFGTDEQKERWLFPLVAGEIRSFFSMTEPEVPGSDPTTLRTRAVRDGDEYVIDGHKWFSSGAEGAAFGIVMAVTDPGRRPARARVADRRPRRHGRRRDRARDPDHGPPRAQLVDPLRGALHERPRAGGEPARRRRRRLPDRAEAARPGTHPPRDALARPDAARVRADVHVLARARGVRRAARAEADRAELDRRQLRRDPGVPPDDARRCAQDRRAATRRASRSPRSSSTRHAFSRT